ncbi:MAG: acyltransferase, partial [Bacteroidaceae bacterium]
VYKPAPCLNQWLDTLDPSTPNNDIYGVLKDKINLEIHKNYTLYPNNYVAADLIMGNYHWAEQQKYSPQDRQQFEEYLDQRVSLVDLENPDPLFLRQTILAMYANPLFNHLKALNAE